MTYLKDNTPPNRGQGPGGAFSRETPELLPAHLHHLLASGISLEVIQERGYRSITSWRDLVELGFSKTQGKLTPGILVPLHGVDGTTVGHQFRPDRPRTNAQGRLIKYETPTGATTHLDAPLRCRAVLGDPTIPLWVTEGAKKADALASRGACAVSLAGVWSWRGRNERDGMVALPELHDIALNGRDVRLTFDSDAGSNDQVAGARTQFGGYLGYKGAKVQVVHLPQGKDGAKIGIDDYLAQGHTLEDALALAQPFDGQQPHTKASPSHAETLVRLALGQGIELFLDQNGTPYARMPSTRTVLAAVRGREFRRWLMAVFYKVLCKVPGTDALSSALGVLEGLAQFSGQSYVLAVRVAAHDGAYWYDLGDGRAVRTTAQGWEIVEKPPILFRRFPHQKPQVEPQHGGSLQSLSGFLPPFQEEHDYLMSKTSLVCGLVPDIPHPLIVPTGPQGSAKTSMHQVNKELLDPSRVRTFAPPRDVAELIQAASHHYVYFLDNLSYCPTWLADCLCRLVSGEGFSKRMLYSDDDDQIYAFRCVAGVNDRVLTIDRPDVLDRSLLFPLERIQDSARREEREFWAAFEEAKPGILGAMFDTLARAILEYPHVQLGGLPRMADFARWGCAVARAWGRTDEDFLKAYEGNIGRQNEGALETSAIAQAILQFMANRDEWAGTASELFEVLTPIVQALKLERNPSWPKAADWVWRRIQQVKPNLAAMGVEAERGGRTAGHRIIRLHRPPKK